ncbi:kinetochore protein NUF2 homolog isoform X1 [Solanum pennellii]|uniref:Kinetochore protein NUF2 homolog isoform X1 n=2 Tax=Solanum pennellii TaxID=28526 RepID=A0ABM1FEW5_SOLPN|nr:kinetochore protein NUF2 homolog isoform X1 [Solanum pennellii]
MSRFDYPTLPRQDIIAVLGEAQIASVSDEDLIKPTPDFVTKLYSSILLHIDTLQDDHDQVDFSALEHLENPDLHVDSFRTINLFHKIRNMLSALGCPEIFTLRDLIKPDPDRTRFFVGAILNFCLHRDTKLNAIRPIVEDLTLIDEQRLALEARISQLNEEIAVQNESREREMPLVQEIDSTVKELRQTISGLNNHQMSLKASIRKLKERAKEIDEKISNADFALVQAVHDNANLRSKIVQSPDKLQRALEEKKSFQAEIRNAERAAMQSFQDKTAILEVYTKAYKKMSKNFNQMQAIQEQVNSTKSIEKDVKVLKLKLSDEEVQEKSLEAKLVERQGKADQLEELRKQLEKEKNLSFEEANKELKNVKLEVESKRHGLEARQNDLEGVLAEADAITERINSVRESGALKCQELDRNCEEVIAEFYRHSSSIKDLLPDIEVDQASVEKKGVDL